MPWLSTPPIPRMLRLQSGEWRFTFAVLGLGFLASLDISAHATEIWFSPRWQIMLPYIEGRRPISYEVLFTPDAPWPVTAAHVNVFGINNHFVEIAGDAALTRIFKNLRERHIKVVIEMGVLTAEPGKGHLEGFQPEPASAQFVVDRIKAHGGNLDYVAMDEPYWYASVYQGQNAYRWSTERIAANVAQTMKIFQAAFPAIQLGDVEPVVDDADPDLIGRYTAWIDAMEAAWGKPLAFFHADILWGRSWRSTCTKLRTMLTAKHIPFGIIYNTPSGDLSNDHWLAAAQQHYEDMENNGGPVPDHAIFESWTPMPDRLLPETDPGTHTHLVFDYLRGRMNFTVGRNGSKVTGTLEDEKGQPVAAPSVMLEILRQSGEVAYEAALSDAVPEHAAWASFEVDGNLKGLTEGALDLELGTARFSPVGTAVQTFAFGSVAAAPGSAVAAQREKVVRDGQPFLHLTASPTQKFHLLMPRFAVTPGTPFSFALPYRLCGSGDGRAEAGVVFFDAAGKPLHEGKRSCSLEPIWSTLSTGKTDAAGKVTFSLPPHGSADLLRLEFPGDATHRAVRVEVK